MAKILSGGYSFEGAPINSQKQNIPTAKQVEAPESLLQFGARNIAQFPASIYETARSGFGIGNLLNMLSERANRSGEGYRQSAVENISSMLGANPEIINEQLASPHLFNMARRGILPTTQEANQELATFLPKYMTEHRPEDYWTQFALTQAPLLAAGGAFKSLPALAKGIGETLGVLGGSELGSACFRIF